MGNHVPAECRLEKEVCSLITKGIKNGLNRFYNDKDHLREGEVLTADNYLSRKRTSCVFDAIYYLAEQSKLPLSAKISKAGWSYQYVLLRHEVKDLIITFCHTKRPGDLPDFSEYRADLAEGNKALVEQISFWPDEINKDLDKSIIVTYNGANGRIPSFVRYGAVTTDQNHWIFQADITNDSLIENEIHHKPQTASEQSHVLLPRDFEDREPVEDYSPVKITLRKERKDDAR